ncbi:hypothetical protein [uncultured Muribaculum sp.]|uniref:hypothetical protein n=1 Tax=uncultured Muribaculum sp. TaxID=1918613 RepID=UPI0025B79E8F|nr:hypothetical protein [uncultured Muribaculum sp.]
MRSILVPSVRYTQYSLVRNCVSPTIFPSNEAPSARSTTFTRAHGVPLASRRMCVLADRSIGTARNPVTFSSCADTVNIHVNRIYIISFAFIYLDGF